MHLTALQLWLGSERGGPSGRAVRRMSAWMASTVGQPWDSPPRGSAAGSGRIRSSVARQDPRQAFRECALPFPLSPCMAGSVSRLGALLVGRHHAVGPRATPYAAGPDRTRRPPDGLMRRPSSRYPEVPGAAQAQRPRPEPSCHCYAYPMLGNSAATPCPLEPARARESPPGDATLRPSR